MHPSDWAWAVKVDGPAEKAVLVALAMLGDARGHATVHLYEVGRMVCAPERTVRHLVDRLVAAGLVHKVRAGGKYGVDIQLAVDTYLATGGHIGENKQPVYAATGGHINQIAAALSSGSGEIPPVFPLAPSFPSPVPSPLVTTNPPIYPVAAELSGSNGHVRESTSAVSRYQPVGSRKFDAATAKDQEAAVNTCVAYYQASGLDWEALTTVLQRRELAIGIDLNQTGANPEEARKFVQWCLQDRTRPQPVDMRVYEKSRVRFLKVPEDQRPGGNYRPVASGLTVTRSIRDLDS